MIFCFKCRFLSIWFSIVKKQLECNASRELYQQGVTALNQALGPVESLRFLRLLDPGNGDYTAERRRRMGGDTESLDCLIARIRAARDKNTCNLVISITDSCDGPRRTSVT